MQNTQTKIESILVFPVTYIIELDWIFYNHDGKKICNLIHVAKVKVIFCIRKNGQNGQQIAIMCLATL